MVRAGIAPDWAEALEPVAGQIAAMGDFLRGEIAAGHSYLPAPEHVLRAFAEPLADVKVLITGQDPYPTPGHPVGLSFSVAPDVRPLPRSLVNIYAELRDDLGIPPAPHGRPHAVVEAGRAAAQPGRSRCGPVRPASHRGKGWEAVTEQAIRALVAREQPLVAILWGRDAQKPAAVARRRPGDRVGAPEPALGLARLLRLATVQPRQRRCS